MFKKLRYNVDIINFTYKGEIKLEKYDVIFGFGDIFEKSFYDKSFKRKRIFYTTGAEQGFQIEAELKRIKEFNNRYKVKVLPKIMSKVLWNNSYYFSD